MEPKIRLKGFSGEWKEMSLLDVVSLYNGLTYTPNDIRNHGTLVLRSSNVQEGEITLLDNVYVRNEVATSPNVEKGDIIVVVRNGSRALIGKHAQIKETMPNTVIGAFMAGMHTDEPEFMNALLSTDRFNNEVNINLGATINQITNGTFRSMKFLFPAEEEQQSIGEFFQNLDSLILSTTKKIESLKQVKAASLQSMFPQEGETKPRVRFKGFEGDWASSELAEIATIKKGEQINKSSLSSQGKYYVLNGGMQPSGYTDAFNTLANTISISEGGNSCGYVCFNEDKFWSGGHNYTLQNVKIHSYFLFAYLKGIENFIMNKRVGSGLPNIQKGALAEISVKYPKELQEQAKIAEYFSNLDKQISLQEQRLEKLKQIKSACLANMFV